MKLPVAVLVSVFAATVAAAQLNPTVQRLPRPSGPVPPECERGLLPAAAPRIDVGEMQEPQVPAAVAASTPPATRSLRAELQEVQTAAGRGDRTRFREALARAKATLAGYPAGGERTAAAAAVRVWDDIDRLWTYQIESPTGAFFDQSSDVYRIVSTYPGYEEAIRRQTFTTAGRRIYPSVESRALLVNRITGVSGPAPPTRCAASHADARGAQGFTARSEEARGRAAARAGCRYSGSRAASHPGSRAHPRPDASAARHRDDRRRTGARDDDRRRTGAHGDNRRRTGRDGAVNRQP